MKNDVIYNKVTTIERCIKRVEEVYEQNPENLKNFTLQDSIILNIQRACEASIDLAMHLVSEKRLGLPQTSREAFDLLEKAELVDPSLVKNLKAMVGFRNIAVHDYQAVNLSILESIIEKHMKDFIAFTKVVLQLKG